MSESNNILLSDWLKCQLFQDGHKNTEKCYTCTAFYMLNQCLEIFLHLHFVFAVELCFIYQYTASANMYFVYIVEKIYRRVEQSQDILIPWQN